MFTFLGSIAALIAAYWILAVITLVIGYACYFLLSQDTAKHKLFSATSLFDYFLKPFTTLSFIERGYIVKHQLHLLGTRKWMNEDSYFFIVSGKIYNSYSSHHRNVDELIPTDFNAFLEKAHMHREPLKRNNPKGFTKVFCFMQFVIIHSCILLTGLALDLSYRAFLAAPVATVSTLGTVACFFGIRLVSKALWDTMDKTNDHEGRISKLEGDKDDVPS